MTTIIARNVNDAFVEGLWHLRTSGVKEDSRLGPVIVAPTPVMTVYSNPCERVLFDEKRNANPFFHLAECVWMLAGSRDVRWITQFNSQMLAYTDDGEALHGAYGHRWRSHFGVDQIATAIRMLQRNPLERKVVITMWSPALDFDVTSRDIPCNTHIYLRINADALDLTVLCRSNDVVWGAYGANAVHFSFLQEFLAQAIGVPVGCMYQFSNNYHIYERHWPLLDIPTLDVNPYPGPAIVPILATGESPSGFLRECKYIIDGEGGYIGNRFLRTVALPMLNAWCARKGRGITYDLDMPECDWKHAGLAWLERHHAK